MKQELMITQISNCAWQHVTENRKAWMMLSLGGIVVMLGSMVLQLYSYLLDASWYLPSHQRVVFLALSAFGAFYTALLHKNALDAAYDRKLSMWHISKNLAFASLFFIALSLYKIYPDYSFVIFQFAPHDFKFLYAANMIIHALVSYLLVRCMFVGMVIIEDRCSVMCAFKRSFAMTARHFFLLLGIFIYLALALSVAMLPIFGYLALQSHLSGMVLHVVAVVCGIAAFVAYSLVLPYTLLVKALLFKHLHAQFSK